MCVAIVSASNSYNDEMGNIVASIVSEDGSGDINQGGDANAGAAKYENAVSGSGNGNTTDNAIAGNQEATLLNNSLADNIAQNGDGDNNDDSVLNQVTNGPNGSDVNFNVANMNAKTANAHANDTVAQQNDNNNASNKFNNAN